MRNLQILFLHQNNIEDSAQFLNIINLVKLRHLTLLDNPVCSKDVGYRNFFISVLPKLIAIDTYYISDEERLTDFSYNEKYEGFHIRDKIQLEAAREMGTK